MAVTKHFYKNTDITVLWQPAICIHSAICFKGLPGVFDPRRRPWIDINSADTETIVEQVKKCPSGALSFTFNDIPGEDQVRPF